MLLTKQLKGKMSRFKKKNKRIKTLLDQLSGNVLAQQLAEKEAELNKLKKAHKELLKARKTKKKDPQTVPIHIHKKLQNKLKDKEEDIKHLEFENLLLKESAESDSTLLSAKANLKTYSDKTRMHVYDCIVNKTPTANIPTLLNQFYKRSGLEVDSVPQRSSCELMARELGAISELQTAEAVLDNTNVTIGFDATTQEEQHINSIHFTTKDKCYAAAVDELPGGTADDYAQHIVETVDNLCDTYTYFIIYFSDHETSGRISDRSIE